MLLLWKLGLSPLLRYWLRMKTTLKVLVKRMIRTIRG